MSVNWSCSFSGWGKVLTASIIIVIFLSACAQAGTPTAAPQPVNTQPPAATETAAPPPTEAPTATEPPTPTLAPTATELPTATQLPALAVNPDGFNVWCAPVKYAGTKPTGIDAPVDARKLTVTQKNALEVLIPAAYCVVTVRFNQPSPAGTELYLFDAKSPFIKTPLQPVDGQPDIVWAAISHPFVVNPPAWRVSYDVAVMSGDSKELWKQPVTFYKDVPYNCPYGGLPDPVTLYCDKTDPWEVEPHDDAVYPWKTPGNPGRR